MKLVIGVASRSRGAPAAGNTHAALHSLGGALQPKQSLTKIITRRRKKKEEKKKYKKEKVESAEIRGDRSCTFQPLTKPVLLQTHSAQGQQLPPPRAPGWHDGAAPCAKTGSG